MICEGQKERTALNFFFISNKFHSLHNNTAKGIVTSSQHSLHISQHSSFTFEQQWVSWPSESCSPSSAANSTWHSSGLYNLQNDILIGCLSKKQMSENLIVSRLYGQCGHCASKFCDVFSTADGISNAHTHTHTHARARVCVCVAWRWHGGETHVTYFLCEGRGKHSTSSCLTAAATVQCCHSRHDIRINNVCLPKRL
jgi:hypothetical protein